MPHFAHIVEKSRSRFIIMRLIELSFVKMNLFTVLIYGFHSIEVLRT